MPANAPERQQQDPDSFLMGGGVPSAAFPKIGASVSGTISEKPYLQQQRDFTTQEMKVWEDGQPMMQLVVTLQTDEHDDELDDDDGRRRIYVRSHLKRAVADAVRKAKANSLEVGGVLTVTYTENGTSSKKAMQPPKLYSATYVPPGSAFLDKQDPDEDEHPAGKPADRTVDWSWSDAVRYARDHGIDEDTLKKELKGGGFTKIEPDAVAFVKAMCRTANQPLKESEIPW